MDQQGVRPVGRPESETKTGKVFLSLFNELNRVIVGQDNVLEDILIALFSSGHVLLEGVPGTAKTLMIKTLSNIIAGRFERIQFTPDMMPSDVVGTHVYDMKTSEFYLKKGPIFTNLLLADEINRTSPKTQSALLEAMEEFQVTIEGERLPLSDLFVVFATQNPIEFEGTYPLPEAQMDRFMFKILVDYPVREQELQILKAYHNGFDPRHLEKIPFNKINYQDFLKEVREEIRKTAVREEIFDYIVKIGEQTRKNGNVSLGVSPRGIVALLLASKTRAVVRGRNYVIPDDVKESAYPVFRHRLILRPEAEIEGISPDEIIREILARVEVPR
ncbi:MAG: MoxR family ATPase [Firmicutes bacterium]|nr:MoxR family ATPase [Bacillota bacterium]